MSTAELKLNGTTIISESGGTADLHNLGTVDTTGLKINGTTIVSESGGTATLQNSSLSSSVDFPAGHMLQVLQKTRPNNNYSIASNAYESVGLDFAITTKQDNSKILVISTIHIYLESTTTNTWSTANFALYRNDSVIRYSTQNAGTGYSAAKYATDTADRWMGNFTFNHLDNPLVSAGTTITYEVKVSEGSGVVLMNNSYGLSDITLIEVSG